MYEQIRYEVSDPVATITLARPKALNAWTQRMAAEVKHAIAQAEADAAVVAIVLTGEGRGFCAGADLSVLQNLSQGGRGEESPRELASDPGDPAVGADFRGTYTYLMSVRKPIIAAINGPAVGVGATLPLQWDIRLAAESARIGFVFVRRGVVPEALSTWILPRLVGLARAAELLMTGRILSAREALEAGLVSRVLPDGELLPAARALAAEIARDTAPVSVAITKWMLWAMQGETDLGRADDLDARAFWWTGTQPDAREGIQSFLAKRAARWGMRPSRDMPDFLEPPSRRVR
jgi:enoyl-CoA hydratase/carnithine racemase